MCNTYIQVYEYMYDYTYMYILHVHIYIYMYMYIVYNSYMLLYMYVYICGTFLKAHPTSPCWTLHATSPRRSAAAGEDELMIDYGAAAVSEPFPKSPIYGSIKGYGSRKEYELIKGYIYIYTI